MNNEVVIEKNVPLPPKKAGRQNGQTAVFEQMQVGDSVVLEGKGRSNFIQYMRRKNKAFATRLIDSEDSVRRYRCWRVDGRRKAA